MEASTLDLHDGATSKKERKASAATARFTIYKANKASKKKREKSSAKKERKATKTLAIVLGEFEGIQRPLVVMDSTEVERKFYRPRLGYDSFERFSCTYYF